MALSALTLLIISACSSRATPVEIPFEVTWQGRSIGCSDDDLAITDLRFYVSNISVTDSSGTGHAVRLTPDSRWQQGDVALIDLESGGDHCVNGTSATNRMMSGVTDAPDIVGLRFTVGVPFESNHADPLLAQPPLNDSAMHWHWRSGYKFLRAGFATARGKFWLHLGSTGCEGTVRNITGCRYPNRVQVDLATFLPGSNTVGVDLAQLFHGVDLTDARSASCSSGLAEEACAAPFEALGLEFPGTRKPNLQRVFGVLR